jgi:hypothetical protein
MTRIKKSLGVALLALCAFAGFQATAAQAALEFWTVEHATIKMTPDVLGFNLPTKIKEVGTITCSELTAEGTLAAPTPTFVAGNLKYTKCDANANKFPVTVFTNGCEYGFTVETEISGTEHEGTFEVFCPAGKTIEYKVYSNAFHTFVRCTVKVGQQVAGKALYQQSETAGGPKIITANINNGSVQVQYSGEFCGAGEEAGVPIDGKLLMHAENKAGKTIELKVKKT